MTTYSRPRAMRASDDVSGFDSGQRSLDDYLRQRALKNHRGGASRCYVTLSEGRVVGYYALSAGSLLRAEAPSRIRRNMPDPIPVLLLARLAVDSEFQGRGLGSQLLRDALIRVVAVADLVGVRGLLVNALDESAAQFYLRMGFVASPANAAQLVLAVKDAEEALK